MADEDKMQRLERLLQDQGPLAVAFSGGADSSFLARMALRVLGAGNVLLLHGSSCLETASDLEDALSWPQRHGLRGVEVLRLPLNPLGWKEFVANTAERCYFCKRRMYGLLLEEMERRGCAVLCDATNLDDLKQRRPGLRAIRELGVRMPLVDAGCNKDDIRRMSRALGLDTWDRPANSCLATRIPHGLPVTGERLQLVASCEGFLLAQGFAGCRVTLLPDETGAILAVRGEDMQRLVTLSSRSLISQNFLSCGLERIMLDLAARG